MTKLSGLARLALVLVPICAASTSAGAAVIYDATGGVENGGDPLSAAGPIMADRFVNTTAANLTSVTLNLSRAAGPGGTFAVNLYTDAGPVTGPGIATLIASGADTSLSSVFTLFTFTPLAPISLAAATSYYIGIANLGGSAAILGNTLDPAVLGRPPVVAGGFYYNNGGVQANAGGPYEIIVNAAAVPEPAGWAALLGGAAMLGLALRRSAV